jgi:hypothetical protein
MILILLILSAVTLMGQVSSSSLGGVVRDSTSATVEGVTITAVHESTGFLRTAITSDTGGYRIDQLMPGAYTVTAQRAGFRSVAADNVTLAVNQKGRLDFTLTVGNPGESITVTATISPVQADDA